MPSAAAKAWNIRTSLAPSISEPQCQQDAKSSEIGGGVSACGRHRPPRPAPPLLVPLIVMAAAASRKYARGPAFLHVPGELSRDALFKKKTLRARFDPLLRAPALPQGLLAPTLPAPNASSPAAATPCPRVAMAWGTPRELDVAALLERARGSRALYLLPSRKLDGAGCQRLCAVLAEAPGTLTELDVSGHVIGDEGVRAIGAFLAAPGCALERLGLGDPAFGAGGVRALTDALGGVQSSLSSLGLEYRGLGVAGGAALASLLSTSLLQLRDLNLARNPLGDEGLLALLSGGGAGLLQLDTLDVSGANLTAAAASSLAAAVAALNGSAAGALGSLSRLKISSNDLGDSGAAALALLIEAAAARLSCLSARECRLGATGVGRLGEAIGRSGVQLALLDLEENAEMGDAGCVALAEGLARRSPQKGGGSTAELKLGSCGCADAGAAALARVSGIVTLSLPHSLLGAAGAAALLGLPGLRHLGLFDNSAVGFSLGGEGANQAHTAQSLVEALRAASSLDHLDLGACGLADPRLLCALAHPTCAAGLRCVELNGNPLESDMCWAALADIRRRRPELDVVWRPPQQMDAPAEGEGEEDDEPPPMD